MTVLDSVQFWVKQTHFWSKISLALLSSKHVVLNVCVCVFCVSVSTQFCSWSGRNWHFSRPEESAGRANGEQWVEGRKGGQRENGNKRMGWGGGVDLFTQFPLSCLWMIHSRRCNRVIKGGGLRGLVSESVEWQLIIQGAEILFRSHFSVEEEAGLWWKTKFCPKMKKWRAFWQFRFFWLI